MSSYDSVPTPETKVLTLTQWRTGVTEMPDRTARVVRCHTCGCVVKSPHYRTCGEKKVVKEGKRKKAVLAKCSERLANRSLGRYGLTLVGSPENLANVVWKKKLSLFFPLSSPPLTLTLPSPGHNYFFWKKKTSVKKAEDSHHRGDPDCQGTVGPGHSHTAQNFCLSCPWGRDPEYSFVNSSYSFPQHCMSYRLSVGAGLLTNLFLLLINTHERNDTSWYIYLFPISHFIH